MSKLRTDSDSSMGAAYPYQEVQNAAANILGLENPQVAREAYIAHRNSDDEAIRIGVFGEDVDRALESPDTVFLDLSDIDGTGVRLPVLIPLDILEWYNVPLLERTYGEGVKAFYYAHPPVRTEADYDTILALLRQAVDDGYVVVSDKYQSDQTSPIAHLVEEAAAGKYSLEAFGGDDSESRADVFAGSYNINGISEVRSAPSLFEAYEQAVRNGDIAYDAQNGPALAPIIEGEEAEEIWNIYDKPFEGLGENDPIYAGFDKEQLLKILKDPETAKLVNRVNGDITTLCVFLNNFENAPWFNYRFYEKNYPEYFSTDNIFMFPGIVTDETKRGQNYATDVIDLATKLMSMRGSNILVTFECTQISTTYIPALVEAAVNHSGLGRISNLDSPISVISYYAIKSL